ncbi:MAG: hypothetical protein A2782_04550 [Candidatus Blackburnbacteria bacterium RIFCSPHIGHO2_01_FULL_43_15b]|uniref:TrpR-related protein YerC/YecD n=1 Tax=Candidatus Blackburnbacteria bacterium RIFCSPHIGHO2_01_FULL_43_15b TaxID=1797513 RepID=A0A1G1V3J4_9BACT|nr:MAG: hypothetical protein A2782_04550 [Candidatus Blackburnbacteria bacterium RIFCSPHIGHO2_01_FULL_43_15b]
MRLSKGKVNPHLKKELYQALHQTLADLKNPQDIKDFLEAFLSEAEHETLTKRVAVAYWLDKGRSYVNICDNLKVSSATIAVVQDACTKHKGVKLALNHIKAEEWANVWAEKIKKFVR